MITICVAFVLMLIGLSLISDSLMMKLYAGGDYIEYAKKLFEKGSLYFNFQTVLGLIIMIFAIVLVVKATIDIRECCSCGKTLMQKGNYCPHCGAKIDDDFS